MEHYYSETLYCIYVHINKINKKMYIGKTKDTKSRWHNGLGYCSCTYFHNAIMKYGWENFEHVILLYDLTNEMANVCEMELIKKYNTQNHDIGYNISDGGDGVRLTGKNNPRSVPVYQYDLQGNFIKKWDNSKIAGEHLSINGNLIRLSAKFPQNNRAGSYLWSFEKHDKITPAKDYKRFYSRLYQFDLNGNLINIYDNLDSLKHLTKNQRKNLRRCCEGEFMSYFNCIWMFEQDYSEDLLKQRVQKKKHEKKNVAMYDLNGNLIQIFNSVYDASNQTGISQHNIRNACTILKKHITGGYMWYYYEENGGNLNE